MKEITIAKVIAAKRKEKGITQDTLAEYIGVSKASVSKWETAQSFPDITLLPQLAAYFNITIDELIGYLPQMTKEDIKKTYHRLAADFSCKPFDEVLGECREITKKYFSCFPLLMQIAILLLNHYNFAKEKEKQEEILKEIMDICVRIKEESEEVWLAQQANSIQAFCLLLLKQPLDALELLDESMKPALGDHALLSQVYQMTGNPEKAKTVIQVSLYQNLIGLLGNAQSYLMLSASEPEKFEQALERFLQIATIFQLESLNPNVLCVLYLAGAQGYAMQQKRDKALLMLEKYSHTSTTYLLPFILKGDAFFDKIDNWLKDFATEAPRDEKTIKQSILQSVAENPIYSNLQEDSRYKKIIEKLKAYAGGI